jgi:hypothetical protein
MKIKNVFILSSIFLTWACSKSSSGTSASPSIEGSYYQVGPMVVIYKISNNNNSYILSGCYLSGTDTTFSNQQACTIVPSLENLPLTKVSDTQYTTSIGSSVVTFTANSDFSILTATGIGQSEFTATKLTSSQNDKITYLPAL